MANSDSFYIDKNDKLKVLNHNSRELWIKGGELEGKANIEIEVFTSYNHEEEAMKIYNALKNAGLENHYYKVRIEIK